MPPYIIIHNADLHRVGVGHRSSQLKTWAPTLALLFTSIDIVLFQAGSPNDKLERHISFSIRPFLAIAAFVALWLCAEHRLGRRGSLKWSSVAAAVCILLQAASYGTDVLFVPVSILTLLVMGEW